MLETVAAVSGALLVIITVGGAALLTVAGRTTDPGPALDGPTLATVELPLVELPPWRTAPTPTREADRCEGCQGRRCRAWREGRDCHQEGITERAAYAAGRPLPRDGRHSTTVRIAHWARIDRLHQLRDRMGIPPARVLMLP